MAVAESRRHASASKALSPPSAGFGDRPTLELPPATAALAYATAATCAVPTNAALAAAASAASPLGLAALTVAASSSSSKRPAHYSLGSGSAAAENRRRPSRLH